MAIRNDGSIVSEIAAFLERFVLLPQEPLYELLGAWIIATHLQEHFEYIGYVFVYSAKPQSGKSRLLEILDLLVYNSSEILISPTEAVLFRTANNGTQLLDEVDTWTNRDVLRGVLNAGFRKGATVPRMRELKGGEFCTERFPVYAPRALAGIGHGVLAATTLDRAFRIEIKPQKPDERRERFGKAAREEGQALKISIQKWVEQHSSEVAQRYDGSFPYLERFRDRTIDVAQPLVAILEVVYRDKPELDAALNELMRAIAVTRDDSKSFAEEHRILRKLTRLARRNGLLVGTASELAGQCGEHPLTVSQTLRGYGFDTRSVRKDGQPRYRYELAYRRLVESCARYGIRFEEEASCTSGVVSVVPCQPGETAIVVEAEPPLPHALDATTPTTECEVETETFAAAVGGR